jgi:hypothetical protein
MMRNDRDKYEDIEKFISALPNAGKKQMDFSKYFLSKFNLFDLDARIYLRGINVRLMQYLLFCMLVEYDSKHWMS